MLSDPPLQEYYIFRLTGSPDSNSNTHKSVHTQEAKSISKCNYVWQFKFTFLPFFWFKYKWYTIIWIVFLGLYIYKGNIFWQSQHKEVRWQQRFIRIREMTQYDNLNPQKQMKRPAMVNRKIITTNYTYIFLSCFLQLLDMKIHEVIIIALYH